MTNARVPDVGGDAGHLGVIGVEISTRLDPESLPTAVPAQSELPQRELTDEDIYSTIAALACYGIKPVDERLPPPPVLCKNDAEVDEVLKELAARPPIRGEKKRGKK